MSTPATDRGTSPIPGESSLALVALSVLLGLSAAGLIAVLIAGAFVSGLEPAVITAVVFFAVALVGFVVVLVQRRNYLRDVRLGRVIEREPWSGADLLPPG